LELTDPKKYADKKQKAADKAQAAESAEEADEPEAPANLIPTKTQTRPAPDWKDVPDGMAALFHEGFKQQPGRSSDMMRDFTRLTRGGQPLGKSLRVYDLHALDLTQLQKEAVGRNQVI
jgi:hypothetical protein